MAGWGHVATACKDPLLQEQPQMDTATLRPEIQAALSAKDEQRAELTQLRLRASALAREVAPLMMSQGSFSVHHNAVTGVSVGYDDYVASCSWDGSVYVFDLHTWHEKRLLQPGLQLRSDDRAVRAVAASPCCAGLLGCCLADPVLRLYRGDSEDAATLQEHASQINSIDFHPSQPHVGCTASSDCSVLIWDLPNARSARSLRQHLEPVNEARFLGAAGGYETCVATDCQDGHVRLFDIRAPRLQCAWRVPSRERAGLAAQAAGHLLAAAVDSGEVLVWDLRTRRAIHSFDATALAGFEGEPRRLALSPCGGFLVLGSSKGSLLCLELLEQQRSLLPQHRDAITQLSWGASWPWNHPGKPYLVCSSLDGTWSCWIPSESAA